jgi:hypothetical protein
VASHDLPQPESLIWDRLMHSSSQLHFYFLQLRLLAVAPGLSLKLKVSSTGSTADVGEPQEVEGFRST